MKTDILIIGAGPAGIFTAMELIRRGSRRKIVLAEKGEAVENRRCPKSRTGKCMNCRPNCHITTGFSGAGDHRLCGRHLSGVRRRHPH